MRQTNFCQCHCPLRQITAYSETKSSAVTFCSFHAMASSVIYYSTHARQNEIKSALKNYMFLAHAQEPMKLLHLYELLYKYI